MRKTIPTLLAAALLIIAFTAIHAFAGEPVEVAKATTGHANTPVSSKNMPAYLDEDLATKHANFSRFARARLKSFDRNHVMSRKRMQIKRLPDGTYQARYKAVDHSSMICKVRRSSSKISPYVAVVRFYEITFEAIGKSPKKIRHASFTPVKKKRNRHIFSFINGKWQ